MSSHHRNDKKLFRRWERESVDRLETHRATEIRRRGKVSHALFLSLPPSLSFSLSEVTENDRKKECSRRVYCTLFCSEIVVAEADTEMDSSYIINASCPLSCLE